MTTEEMDWQRYRGSEDNCNNKLAPDRQSPAQDRTSEFIGRNFCSSATFSTTNLVSMTTLYLLFLRPIQT